MILKYLNMIMVAVISANIYLFWDTPAVYGWAVALMGWLPWTLEKIEVRRGDS